MAQTFDRSKPHVNVGTMGMLIMEKNMNRRNYQSII